MELVHAPVPELKRLLTSHSRTGRSRKADRVALSGGATALIFLPALRAANVDWSKITLFWTDERAVPADDPESNYGIAERMLLSPLGAKAPRAIRMPADMPRLGEAAAKYDDLLATELRGGRAGPGVARRRRRRSRRVVVPGHRRWLRMTCAPLPSKTRREPPKRRLSLTMRYLLQTRKIWVVAVGPRKLPVLQAALSKTQRSTPLDLVLQQAKDVTVFTDQVIRRR